MALPVTPNLFANYMHCDITLGCGLMNHWLVDGLGVCLDLKFYEMLQSISIISPGTRFLKSPDDSFKLTTPFMGSDMPRCCFVTETYRYRPYWGNSWLKLFYWQEFILILPSRLELSLLTTWLHDWGFWSHCALTEMQNKRWSYICDLRSLTSWLSVDKALVLASDVQILRRQCCLAEWVDNQYEPTNN